MIEIRVRPEDAARVRYAYDPLQDAVASFYALAQPSPRRLHRRLVALAADSPPHAFAFLEELCGDDQWVPDLMVLEPTAQSLAPEDALARVAEADLDVVEQDLAHLRATRPRSPLAGLDAHTLRERTATALVDYSRAVLSGLWPRLIRIAEADIAYRARLQAAEGLAGALADLNHLVHWHGDRISVDLAVSAGAVTDGGLWLVPSTFRWPCVLVAWDTDRPILVYAARGAALLWEGTDSPSDPVMRLLGASRARLLSHATLPTSTTELSEELGLAMGTVSEHLRALVEGGLLRSGRHGRRVLYERTDLGEALVTGAAPVSAEALGQPEARLVRTTAPSGASRSGRSR